MRSLAWVLLWVLGSACGDNRPAPTADAAADRQSPADMGQEAPADALPDMAMSSDAGADGEDPCPFACDEPSGPGSCRSNCPNGNECCCEYRNRCEMRLSPSECCRR